MGRGNKEDIIKKKNFNTEGYPQENIIRHSNLQVEYTEKRESRWGTSLPRGNSLSAGDPRMLSVYSSPVNFRNGIGEFFVLMSKKIGAKLSNPGWGV